MKTKLFTLFVALVCAAQVSAYDFESNGICYNYLGGDSVEVTSNDGYYTYDEYGNEIWVRNSYSGNIVVPAQVAHESTIYRVTSIGYSAFISCPELTSITIPVSITSANGIGYECPKLTSIIWNAKRIDEEYGSNIFAFYEDTDCPITSFIFGDEVEYIPSVMCQNMNNITSVTIPKNVKEIGYGVFNDCSNLTTITWNAINCHKGIEASNGILWDSNADSECPLTTVIIGKNVQQLPYSLFNDCNRLTQTIYMGDIASWCKITFGAYNEQYGYWEYSGANPISYSHNLYINGQSITNLVIPEGVTSISDYAFGGLTPLTTVSFPSTLTSIGSSTFSDCENLTNFVLPNNLTSIGNDAFLYCFGLTEVTIPNSVTTIEESAFERCDNLTTITIGTGLESLGRYAFDDCYNLTKFICNSTNVNTEASYSFVLANVKLDTIIAPASFFDLEENYWSSLAKSIQYIQINGGELTPDAFGVINRSFDKLQTLDISAATNTEIANNAFKGCYKLETLLLPKELETIGYMSFAECVSLKALDIPATVTEIGDRAFEDCRSIETLTFGGQQPANAPIRKETQYDYVSTASTSALQRIGNWAFYNCHELQHLEIPEGVTEIGAAAFYGCVYLEDLTLPSRVQAIGDNCFALCSKLQKITCLATVPPTIEAKTFYEVNRSIPIYVPDASLETYKGDIYWQEFFNIQGVSGSTSGLETLCDNVSTEVRKVLEKGMLYIIRGGEKYTIDGRKVM